jgi:hypothetical protein
MNFKATVIALRAGQVIPEAFTTYPFLKEAIELLGYSKMATMKYHVCEIKQALEDLNKPVREALNLTPGEFITSKAAKALVKDIYAILGVNRSPKGTDLSEYYNLKITTKRIDGKYHKGFEIISKRDANC